MGGDLLLCNYSPAKNINRPRNRLGFCAEEYHWPEADGLSGGVARKKAWHHVLIHAVLSTEATDTLLPDWLSLCPPFWLLDPPGLPFYWYGNHSLMWFYGYLLDFPLTDPIGDHNLAQGKSHE